MTEGITVRSDDGQRNVSDEVWKAFLDVGTPLGGRRGVAAEDVASPADRAQLKPNEVEHLLRAEPWTLVVRVGEGSEALDQEKLAYAVERNWTDVRLRALAEEEKVALDAVRDSATGTLRWLKEGLSVKLVDLVATAGGAFGYVAAKDRLARPDLMVAAACVAMVALVVALVLDLLPRPIQLVKLSRLDLVRAHYGKMVRSLAWASRISVVLVTAAVVLAFFAAVPGEPSSSPAATIGRPSVGQVPGGAASVELTVKWENLGDSASEVRTTILQGDAELLVERSGVSGGGAEQKLELDVPRAGDIEVETLALDARGRQVGYGSTRVFAIGG